MNEDLAGGIAVSIGIICMIVLEILLINGTLPTMNLGSSSIAVEDSAKEDVANSGFMIFIAYNILFILVSAIIGVLFMSMLTLVGKTFFIVAGSIGVLILIKYWIYNIFW